MHKNAVLTPRGRAVIVQRAQCGEPRARIARAMGISSHTVRKWLRRYEQMGVAGLEDRPSRPHKSPKRTAEAVAAEVKSLRLQRRCGQAIARQVGISAATVSRLLRRAHLSRWRELEPQPEVVRYEREQPGDLLHLDIKQLGRIGPKGRFLGDQSQRSRGIGHEYVHVAIDDHSRYSLVTVADDQTQHAATAFLERVVARFAELGVPIRRLLTDNGSCYKSLTFRAACIRLGIKHKFTRPYTPRTNGKAERFIQTTLREWAYGNVYASSAERTAALGHWVHHYNWHRPHSAIGHQPPASRLPPDRNNVLTLHT